MFLQKLIQWEKEIADQVPYLETPTNLFLGIDDAHKAGYSCTPIDAIPFAWTGQDGIHYAFLTDFGTANSLDEAPIIRVSPMDFGECVRLVARNIRDFFAIHLFDNGSLLLNEFASEQAYVDHMRRLEEEEEALEYLDVQRWKTETNFVAERAQEAFQLPLIDNPYHYIQEIRRDRLRQIVLKTKDGLGVIPVGDKRQTYEPHPWSSVEPDHTHLDKGVLQAFFNHAEYETKLAFIRDFQQRAMDDTEANEWLCGEIVKMGLALEAKNLRGRMMA
ncbi:hypothetical protein [Brevibacillus borstelensis]|uniref:hypothetical protein n=1 Tax=Brevibacillus borstelensis TaxID=45462 RepID=UPI0030BE3728